MNKKLFLKPEVQIKKIAKISIIATSCGGDVGCQSLDIPGCTNGDTCSVEDVHCSPIDR